MPQEAHPLIPTSLVSLELPKHSHPLLAFDAIRGIAALAVSASHLRAFLFVDFTRIPEPTAADRIFYFATGLGHQAVMVFFVMSGWLVGGSVSNQLKSNQFQWGDYAVARLARLWTVLLPALLWTALLDYLGISLSSAFGYDGSQLAVIHSGPGGDSPMAFNVPTFLGNLFFLQTTFFPVFGSNGPLWSLASEFWYYFLFPAFLISWRHRQLLTNNALPAAALIVLILLPNAIQIGFAIWLIGWIGYEISTKISTAQNVLVITASAIALAYALLQSKMRASPEWDFVIAAFTTCALYGFSFTPNTRFQNGIFASVAKGVANISYSLYLFHFPLLAFIFFSSGLHQSLPSTITYIKFLALFAMLIFTSIIAWYLFERNTGRMRQLMKNLIVKIRIMSLS